MQDLCTLLERISNTTGTERKKRILTNFIDQWRQAHKKLHPDDADTTVCSNDVLCLTINLVLRLLPAIQYM